MTHLTDQYRKAHKQERIQPERQLWQRLEKKLDQPRAVRRLPFTRIAIAASISVLMLITVAALFLLRHNTAGKLTASSESESITATDAGAAAAQYNPLPTLPRGVYHTQSHATESLSLKVYGREALLFHEGREELYKIVHSDSSGNGRIFDLSSGKHNIRILAGNEGLQVFYKELWYPLSKSQPGEFPVLE